MTRQTDQNMVHRTSQIAETVIGHQETESAAPAHTPTPWYHRQAGETSKHGDPYDWIADSPEHGKHRKIIVARDSCYCVADYAFIVKAVNTYASNTAELRAAYERIDELERTLKEAGLQLEYLHDKFQPTGTGEATLARINEALGAI